MRALMRYLKIEEGALPSLLPLTAHELPQFWQMATFSWTVDYQSERHCSKTTDDIAAIATGLITSQNDTAPKLMSLIPPAKERPN